MSAGNSWQRRAGHMLCPRNHCWFYRYKKQSSDDDDNDATTTTDNSNSTFESGGNNKQGRKSVGLCDFHDSADRRGKLIVQYTPPMINLRLFAMFGSFLDYARYANSISEENRCFYETVPGEAPQKPHFDVDMKSEDLFNAGIGDHLIVITSLVNAINIVFAHYEIPFNLDTDLCIYSSNGPTKYSYHVIINHKYHQDNREARAFYNLVIKEMPPELSQFVDHAVYSSFQQFRMLGSQKLGSGRKKIFHEQLILPPVSSGFIEQSPINLSDQYDEEDDRFEEDDDDEIIINHIYDGNSDDEYIMNNIKLGESLITNISSCYPLPTFIPIQLKETKDYEDVNDITKEQATRVLQYLATNGNITISDRRFPYKIREIRGNCIDLIRTRPSRCPQCNRTHENENPYMIVTRTNQLYMYCRRKRDAHGKDVGYLVGTIPGDKIIESEQDIKDQADVMTTMISRYMSRYGATNIKPPTSSVIPLSPQSSAKCCPPSSSNGRLIHNPVTTSNTSNISNAGSITTVRLPVSPTRSPSTTTSATNVTNGRIQCVNLRRKVNRGHLNRLASQPVRGKKPLKDTTKTSTKRQKELLAGAFSNISW